MPAWSSYALQDFVPFNAPVYLRLLERVNEGLWPLHPLLLLAGILAGALLQKGQDRLAGLLLAACWAVVAEGFFARYYAQLNWAAGYLRWICWLQGGLLLAALTSRSPAPGRNTSALMRLGLGLVLVLAGLAYPVVELAASQSWRQGEFFGVHPDPTALATLGLCLLHLRGWRLALCTLMPLGWCLLSGATLLVLEEPRAWALFTAAALSLSVPLYQTLSPRTGRAD
ncbi:DUF6064 family protein [Motiliproteus sp. SC1-56]|uniref:DUF6064 family protein n=1 Tax=Motiliproteus sp. SC1-56 TaxID=2799565 RepID=UPI001A8EFAC6|nr:DUF6064 family protein [Motiliproteus sp. SC1-56]